MTTAEFSEILSKKRKEMGWEENIFPPPITDREFVEIIRNHLLGDNWYIVNPISHEQINAEAIWEILSRYPHGEQEKEKRRKKIANFFHNIIDSIFE